VDNGNGQPKVEAPSHVLVLTITFDQLTGAINVNGPITNRFVAYGMLELAKDAVRTACENAQSDRRIALPGVTPFGRA
jgi:hypothetical protein